MDAILPQLQEPIKIILFEPQIPPNIGAVSRICACIGSPLYLAGDLSFDENHPRRKRAGLDYWELVEKIYLRDAHEMFERVGERYFLFSTKVGKSMYEAEFRPGDALIFGSETAGLPPQMVQEHAAHALRIPMVADVRSLNLANSVGIAAYEAVRQIHRLSAPH